MERMNPRWMMMGWAIFTLVVDLAAVYGVCTGMANGIVLLLAGAVTVLMVYLLVIYRVDGITFKNALTDERLFAVSAKAQRNSYWVFFFSVWALAIGLNLPQLGLIRRLDLVLPVLAVVGLLVQMVSFLWYKYRV